MESKSIFTGLKIKENPNQILVNYLKYCASISAEIVWHDNMIKIIFADNELPCHWRVTWAEIAFEKEGFEVKFHDNQGIVFIILFYHSTLHNVSYTNAFCDEDNIVCTLLIDDRIETVIDQWFVPTFTPITK